MKPVLLLVPGMFNTGAIWDRLRQELEPELEVRTAQVLTQDSIPAMAADAWQCLADVPAGHPVTLCGFSMGGYVVIEMLARPARALHAAALLDSSAGIETEQSLLVREKTIAALQRNFERTVEGIIPYSLHPDHAADPDLVPAMRSMMHAVGAEAAIRQTRALMVRSDHRAALARLQLPVLVACGRHDRVTPPELSEELAALIPGARLAWLESAGHQTPLECAPELAALLRPLALGQSAA